MLLYDDPAAAVIRDAAEQAGRAGAAGYGTEHVLLGLLRTGDPVTRRVTEMRTELTAAAVQDRLPTPVHRPGVRSGSPRGSRPVPAPEFRQATSRFTAKWRPLVRSGRIRAGTRLGCGELWLAVLEQGTEAARVLRSLGTDPDDLREAVLSTMAPDPQNPPVWPAEAAVGPVRRAVTRMFGRRRRR